MPPVAPLTIHHVTATAITRGLTALSLLLDKAKAHAEATGTDPDAYVQVRLYDDMLPLSGQIQRASDSARGVFARLTGTTAPGMADEETTFAQLQERVARTLAYVESVPAEAFEGAETREVVFGAGPLTLGFTGVDYLLEFALPNFQFHVVTAYDILRSQGVPLGKRDFLNLSADRVRAA